MTHPSSGSALPAADLDVALHVSDSLATGADLRLDVDNSSPTLLETAAGVQPEGVVPLTVDLSPTALTAAAEPAPDAEPRAAGALEDMPAAAAQPEVVAALEAAVVAAPADASGFTGFGLSPELLSGLAAIGFQDPSPIQRAAIPELMLGRDLVGQAQTGTGKTAAFALPLLERLDSQQRTPQVLVLTPTRELAMQVAEAFNSYAAKLSQVRVLAVYGGADFRDQIQQLRRGVQIVVGTPGRVMDHIRQGTLDVSGLRALVLDEADEMLRMGFIDDVEWVLEQLPSPRQVVLFSATMPSEIRRLSQKYLDNPAEVTIRTKGADGRRIRQRFILVQAPQKLEALERVLEAEGSEGVIIFARTKAVSLTVAEALEEHGYDVAVLNGDVPQTLRERTIQRLRDGQVNVLVATDVAARGLDVERISLVINYDVPFDGEAYVHRIGRTGRAGRSGDAILFLTPRERRFLGGMERAVGQPIEPMEVPSNAAIHQHRLDRLHQRLAGTVQQPTTTTEERALLSEVLQRLGQELDCSPSVLALAALELSLAGKPLLLKAEQRWGAPSGRVLENRGGDSRGDGRRESRSGDFRRERDGGRDRRDNDRSDPDRPESPPESHLERFRLEVGWRDHVRPGNIVGAIANEAGLTGRSIGRIRIYEGHSTVDLPKGMPEAVFTDLQRLKVMNKELQISRLPV
ncbi:ATP-dependent RNA helicase DeaD [Cyanobium sp.]|nr:ATP-dependent RNA helicase DeaD [Cyanobium sp.]